MDFGGLGEVAEVGGTLAADVTEQIEKGGQVAQSVIKNVRDVVTQIKGGAKQPVQKPAPQPEAPPWMAPMAIAALALGAYAVYKATRK